MTLRVLVVFAFLFASLPAYGADQFFREDPPAFTGQLPKGPPDFSDLVKFVGGAVVKISSEGAEDEIPAEEKQPLFKDKVPPARSLGTGFVISADGYIVTNQHVVAHTGRIIVSVPEDKEEYEAKLIGKDAKTDLALIKIKSKRPLNVLHLGNSDNLEIGDWVLAIGNQFQLGQTFTAGIVSAKGRRVPTRSSGPYDQFIQTDASINPGSSGGPLINAQGQVVGINTAIYSPGRQQFGGGPGFNIGIGFSIPINMAKDILVQLRKSGKVTRGLLGVIIQSVTNDIRDAMELSEARGALVADVIDSSPAQRAGFRREDVILSYQGKPISEHNDLPLLVANTAVGTEADVVVLRGGKLITLQPKIGTLPDKILPKETEKPEPDKVGLIVEEMTERISEALGQPRTMGVIIRSVRPGSPGADAGLGRGDVIEQIDRKPVADYAAYVELVKNLKAKKPVLVLVRRKEGTRFLTVKP